MRRNQINSFLIYSLLFLCASSLNGQAKYDHVWLHGYDSDQFWPEFFWGTKFDFNDIPMTYGYYEKRIGFNHSATSFSDSLGNLLFYTNGCEIYDANHELVENSYPLAPSEMHNRNCVSDENNFGHGLGYGPSQLVCAVPNLRKKDSYLVILGKYKYQFNMPGLTPIIMESLVISEVIKDDGGGLRVVSKNIDLLVGDLTVNAITMVKHANGLDWWLLTFDALTNRYYSLLLEGNELAHIESDTIGASFKRNEDGWGQINSSPDGTKVVRHSPVGGTMLFDFDRETGRLSNDEYFHLGDDPLYQNTKGGAAFSPDSKLLYITTVTQLFQLEVNARDKLSSALLIDEWDGTRFQDFWEVAFYQMQNGPDCRIYMIPSGTVPYLHVIHDPNKRGLECNFEQRAIATDNTVYPTHLNYPNYRLGTEWEDWCDSTSVSTFEHDTPISDLSVYPNPTSSVTNINLPAAGTLQLYNMNGVQVFQQSQNESGYVELNLEHLPTGFYTLFLISEAGFFQSKVIKQ